VEPDSHFDFGVVDFPWAPAHVLGAMVADYCIGSVLAELVGVLVVDLATSRVFVVGSKESRLDESEIYNPLPNDWLAHTCYSDCRIDVACQSAWAVLVHHRLGRVLRQLLAAGFGVYLLVVGPFFGVVLAPVPEASPASDVGCRGIDYSGDYRNSVDFSWGCTVVVVAVAHGLVPAFDGSVVLRHRKVACSDHHEEWLLLANLRMLSGVLLYRSRLTDQVLGPYAIGR
jgi:hypothetical protein